MHRVALMCVFGPCGMQDRDTMNSEISSKSSARVKEEISTLFNTVFFSYGLGIAGLLVASLTTYFSTRLFSPEVYGQLSMVSMVAGIIQAVGFVWLGSALIRFGKEEYVETGGVHQTFQVRLILLSFIWLATLPIFASAYFFAHGYLATWIGLSGGILWVILLLLTVMVLTNELRGYLNIFGKYRQLAGGDLFSQIIKLAAVSFLFIHYGVSGIGWLIALTIGGMVAQSLYLLAWQERGNFHLGRTSGFQDRLRQTVRYSIPALGTSILGYIYAPIEIFLIRYFISIEAVGLFSMANVLNRIFSNFVMLFPGLTFPILQGLKGTGNSEAMRRYYQRIVPQATILFAPFISMGLICMTPIMKFFLSERYHPAIGTLLILTYAEIPLLPTVLQSSYSYIYDKVSQALWVMLLQYGFELACYFILIPRIGIEGAAWGWVAAYLASAVLLTHYVSQEFGASLRPYFAIALSALLGMGALLLVWSKIPFGLQLLAVVGLIITAGILTKVVKLFDRRDMEWVVAIGMPGFLHPLLGRLYRILG